MNSIAPPDPEVLRLLQKYPSKPTKPPGTLSVRCAFLQAVEEERLDPNKEALLRKADGHVGFRAWLLLIMAIAAICAMIVRGQMTYDLGKDHLITASL